MRFKDGKSEVKTFSKNDKGEVIYGYIYCKMGIKGLSENEVEIQTMGFPCTKIEPSKLLSEYFQGE